MLLWMGSSRTGNFINPAWKIRIKNVHFVVYTMGLFICFSAQVSLIFVHTLQYCKSAVRQQKQYTASVMPGQTVQRLAIKSIKGELENGHILTNSDPCSDNFSDNFIICLKISPLIYTGLENCTVPAIYNYLKIILIFRGVLQEFNINGPLGPLWPLHDADWQWPHRSDPHQC